MHTPRSSASAKDQNARVERLTHQERACRRCGCCGPPSPPSRQALCADAGDVEADNDGFAGVALACATHGAGRPPTTGGFQSLPLPTRHRDSCREQVRSEGFAWLQSKGVGSTAQK
eukprot:1470200-Rhodomonas_salina.1